MNSWKQTSIGEFIDFNPSESLKKGVFAKKIGMDKLGTFQRKIDGFEITEYSAGPKFRNGDTVVAKITPCLENGKTAYVDILQENEIAFGSSEFIVLRENVNSDSKFIYYLARSPLFREKAISCMDGTSGRKRVNEGALKRQEILVPGTKSHQRQIATVLSALDDKIELNNRINTELEQMAKTLYDYWFVQFDFPNEEGKPYKASGGMMEYNEVLKREIPEGWEAGTIHNVGHLLGGGTPRKDNPEFWNGTIPFFTPRDFENSFFIIETEGLITKKGLDNCSSRLYPKGTIFITARGTVGNINLASAEMAMNQSCYAVLPKSNINYYFLHQYCVDLIQYMKVKAAGSVFDALVSNDFKLTNAVVPTKNIIDLFGQRTQSIYEEILINRRQNKQLASLRDWLLPMLMNGQVSVGNTYAARKLETEPIQMVDEPVVECEKNIKLSIPDKSKVFAKQVLGGKIVSLFKDDPYFTHIKFQKLQYLAEHIAEADLDLNYYFQAAGPHDGRFMHTIAEKLKKSRWFEERNYKFYPLEKQDKIDGYYQGYFAPVQDRLDKLFLLLANATEAEAEIFATLYAVWNNRIILKQPILETNIVEDFYKWSDRKLQYSKEQLLNSLEILRNNQMVPTGFGKEIKTAKNKSK